MHENHLWCYRSDPGVTLKTQLRLALVIDVYCLPEALPHPSLLNFQEVAGGGNPLGPRESALFFCWDSVKPLPRWSWGPGNGTSWCHMSRSSVSKKRLLQMPRCWLAGVYSLSSEWSLCFCPHACHNVISIRGFWSLSRLRLHDVLPSTSRMWEGEPYNLVFVLKLSSTLLNWGVCKAKGKPHVLPMAITGLGGLCHFGKWTNRRENAMKNPRKKTIEIKTMRRKTCWDECRLQRRWLKYK